MNNPLFLFVGQSASGKTTIANMMSEKYGYKQVESYTTRPQRYDGERGHIFVSTDEFKNLGDLAAYTFYNNHHYGTTLQQINECDIYVVDIPGVKSLLQNLKNDTRPVCIFYFDASVYNRILRMQTRGDSNDMIIDRLLQDEKDDWYKQLDKMTWEYENIIGKNVELHPINANDKMSNVLSLVMYYVNEYVEG